MINIYKATSYKTVFGLSCKLYDAMTTKQTSGVDDVIL